MATLARRAELSEVAEFTPVRIEVSEEQFTAFEALIESPMPFTEKLESLANMPSPFHPVMTNEDLSSWARQAGKGPLDLNSIPAPFIPDLED